MNVFYPNVKHLKDFLKSLIKTRRRKTHKLNIFILFYLYSSYIYHVACWGFQSLFLMPKDKTKNYYLHLSKSIVTFLLARCGGRTHAQKMVNTLGNGPVGHRRN